MSKSQINLPKTAFSMKANLPAREPEFLKFWDKINLYKELRNSRKTGLEPATFGVTGQYSNQLSYFLQKVINFCFL